MNFKTVSALAIAFCFVSSPVLAQEAEDAAPAAQQKGYIETKTTVEKESVVLDENGNERVALVPVSKVLPGDVVIYTVSYTNIGEDGADNVTITYPISEELEYVADSAFAPGASISFSADGGTTFDEISNLTVSIDGEDRAAAMKDLTHIRWVLNDVLDPGSRGFGRFRARLN
ncbi:MAG: hypothetical protein AAAFM81_12675 [Pseudomonadota bacterium]